jgi:hypothetical protein
MKLIHASALALAALSALLFSAKAASAQAGVYALFTGAHLDTTQATENTPITSPPTYTNTTVATGIYGPTFGLYADLPTPIIKIGGDLRAVLLNGGGEQHYSGVIGPRVSVSLPVVNLKPYGEFLFGIGSYKTTTSNSTTHIDYEYVVGVDRKLLALLSWRILEFSDTNYYNGSVPTRALSTGIVIRLP